MTAISVSERLLEMAAFYTPLALTVTAFLNFAMLLRRKKDFRILRKSFLDHWGSSFSLGQGCSE